MDHLADLLERKQDEVAARWREQVTASLSAESLPDVQLLDSLPLFIKELIQALRQNVHLPVREPLAKRSDLASRHGSQRFKTGFDVATVVREYAVLRDVLFEVAEESEVEIRTREHRVLSKHLLSGVGDAVAQYVIDRDEAVKEQTSGHLAFLAHELRNPLASARLAIAALKRRGAFEQNRPSRVLESSLSRLGELIDRSLIEVRLRGVPRLEWERIRLKDLLEELTTEAYVGAEDRELSLQIQVPPSVTLKADRKLLYSAVSNLFRNALKFTHAGGTVHLRGKDGNGRVVVEVEDECGGLPRGQVEKMFDPFVQVGQDRSGFGLGLAIAKQAAEAHGGTIRVHNLPGKGCVFTLDLPEQPPPG